MSRTPFFSRFMAGIVSVILLVLFLFTRSIASAAPLAITTVSPETPNGWASFLETGTNGSVSFVLGPASPPAGSGSARFVIGSSATGVALVRQAYAGQRFDQITTLTYDTYKVAGTASTLDVALQFNVDYNLTDANTGWQGRLVYEPYHTTPLPDGVWNAVNPLAGEWWSTGAPGNGTCPQSNPCTWSEVLTAFPNAGVQTGGLAGVLFKMGSGPATFDGNVDNFHIVTSGGVDDTYDFENSVVAPGPACTTTCYVSTLGNDSNGGASAGDPLRNIQTALNNVSVGGTVIVAPGVYSQALTISKSLTLNGAGSGTNPAVDTILDGTAISGNGITVANAITNVTIQDLRVRAFASGSGVHGTGGNNNFTLRGTALYNNNSTFAVNGGGLYMNGPVSNVTIDDNDVVGNRARGIVIWNGLKTNITITDNYVANNNCCGIELQDGTATGVTATGNIVENNTDSGMAFVGLMGPGANLIANNTVSGTGRFGIEIKLPNGSGADSGAGSIVVEDNTVTLSGAPANNRDLAGISVYRRGWVTGNNNVDIPTGVIVRDNEVTGFQQPSASDGFGIVVEGTNHQVTGNELNNNDVGVQAQGGHLPYTPNSNVDGNQDLQGDQYFGRGNSPTGCPVSISTNTFSGNTTNTRFVGTSGLLRATNVDTGEQFCAIQAAIDDAQTLNGHVIEVEPGIHNEAVTITKSITLQGAGSGTNPATDTILDGTSISGHGITVANGITNVTIEDLRVRAFASGSGINGVGGNNGLTVRGTALFDNNSSNAVNGGGLYMNGPVSNVTIDNNDVVNNRARGIVIWNGLKTNITITDNYVANNNCCGIELQDGTATGVTATGNTVTNNTDSGMAFVGLMGPGANLIANNTISGTGRFGIEIKLPNGSGLDTGAGSIVVEDNTVTLSGAPANNRDLAGISVYRRGWVTGNNNVDIPTGVIVRNNEVNGFQQPSASDGFGIVVEGTNHQVTGNGLNNNDVGVQAQGGHLPYTPNSNVDGNQDLQGDQYFGRGNSPVGCPVSISGNTFTGNSSNTRFVGTGGLARATNIDTNEQFCTIQAAIDDAQTLNGHTILVEPGVHNEAVTITKSITLQGAGSGTNPATDTILDGTAISGHGITVANGITNVTIEDLRVRAFASGSGINGVGGNNNFILRGTALYDNNSSNAVNGGGLYMNGPVSNVTIDDNDVVNNRARGIVIWNGLKTNITITNNYVANNNCCGIELQDGTATGVTATGNTVTNNTDSGMAFVGLMGPGANLIANNTISGTGRFGIEIKLPNGSGLDTGAGSIVIEDNTVTLSGAPANNRDLAGISVYRRGWVAGNNNVDIPTGVIVRDNEVNGYQQPSASDGFGIVVEGTNHQVTGNELNNNDVGVQAQGGHLPYTPNTNVDGNQDLQGDQYFGRGNSPVGCPVSISANIFSGNSTNTRFVGPSGYRATNVDTNEQFCTIQAAINDADTIDGHTIVVEPGTHVEQLVINKAITLEGAQAGVPAKDRVGPQSILRWSSASTPITLADDNITIDGFVFNAQGAATSWIINAQGEPGNGTFENISILNNEFIGNAGPHPTSNNPGGMYLYTFANTLIEGNYFNDLGNHGVFMANTSNNTTYRNNDSYRNYNSNFSAHTGSHTNVTVENNRAIEDSMILFNVDGAIIQNNVFTATAATASRIYMGGGSSNITVDGNQFNGVRSAAIISFDGGFGYGVNTNMTITDNTITATVGTLVVNEVGLIDVRDTTGTNSVTGNTITVQSGTLGVNTVRGISLRGALGTTTVAANTINGNNVDNSPATPSIGVYLQSSITAGSTVAVQNNVISGWNSGVEGGTLVAGVNATVYQNNLNGNTPYAVANGAGIVLNASANWYGTNTPAGVNALVTPNVDYTPWFNSGTDTSGTAGWQGDFSWFNADDTSPQSGAVGRINESVALVTTGGTVNLAAGTYNETTTIPKSLTLQGAEAGTNPATHTILEGFTPTDTVGNGITLNSGVSNVTIQNLRVQNFDLDGGFVAGIFGNGDNSNITISGVHLYGNNRNAPNTSQGGGIHFANGTNGPADITITASEAVTNTGRGIALWIGAREGVTITESLVSDNSIVGIDLSGGTSEGVYIVDNTVTENGDSGIAVSGMQAGSGANRIAENIVTNNGRFGIEVKMANGSGVATGDGSIVIEDNNVSLTAPIIATELRDLAGIAVFRRDYVAGNADIPTGVIVRDNTVSGYTQSSVSEGFGIVVEGVNHQVTTNTLNNNEVGVQVQGGHLPYTPNGSANGDQSNLSDQFFGRGNAPYGCAAVSGNIFSGNTANTRSIGNGGSGIRATNINTSETFCTIQAAIDDAQTLNGHTIEVAAGTWEEQVEVNKAITLEGQGEGLTTILAPLDMPDFFNSGVDNNYPIIYVHHVNATIRDLTVDGDGRGNLNYRFLGVAFEQAGGLLEDVTITGIVETPRNGNQHGTGVWARANNGTNRTLTVTDVSIDDFQKNGTTFTGANLTVAMNDSAVVGAGPLGVPVAAQNGIQLSGGAFGSFDGNTVSGINYTPNSFASIGILITGAGGDTQVTNNTVTDTKNAIDFREAEGNAVGNTVTVNAANMGAATSWWGITVYNTTAEPLVAGERSVLPASAFDDGALADSTPERQLVNRDYLIEDNTLNGGSGGFGIGVYALASELTDVTIHNNTIDEWEGGIDHYTTTNLNTVITANTVTDSDYGIYFFGGTATISNNLLNNNGVGVWVDGGTVSPVIYENSITSTGLGVNKTAAGIAVVNASTNWWGSNVPATVAGEVSAGVDYTPWFNVGTDASATVGWQGDFSWFNADDSSPQTGAVGRINEAIALVTTGGTVNLAAGTYNEGATVPKSLTLQGAGATTILDGNTPAATTGNGITLNGNVTNVTIQDLRVQDYGGAAPGGSGIFGTVGNNNLIVRRTELFNNNLANVGNGGGLYMNGPVNNVTVDDNDVVNNRSRGIVIWNGLKTNITITNNYVANNICCGIELQDGTASGVTVTGNVVENNGDSGMAFIGLQGGSGANLISGNTITNNGRFGIEIKLPNGNGLTSGDGSIVIENNTVSRNVAIPGTEQRDLAGISVYRRGWLAGNVDIPVGVIVRNNTVSGYAQPTTSDGFGIVVEGNNHQVVNNTLNNNDVGVQVQGGHLPYTPNTSTDGDQSNLNDQFFGRGNAPIGCSAVSGNVFSGNTTDTRSVGNGGAGIRATNTNTLEQFCTIQAAIDDSDTVNGNTINIAAGVWVEQVEVYKDLTLQGAGTMATTIQSPVTLTDFFTSPGNNNYPVVLARNTNNVTIRNLTVDGAGRGNTNYRFTGVAFENVNGTIENVRILNIRNNPIDGAQHGIALWGRAQSGTPRTLMVNNVTLDDFQKNGTAFSGANLSVTMNNSTVTGEGAINFTAQNGIQLSGGAAGSFDNNTVTGFTYTPYTFVSTGYLIFGASGTVNITNGDINESMVGAYYYNAQGNVTDNNFVNTAAGMGSAPYWFGVLLENDTAAPFTADGRKLTPSPFDTGEGAMEADEGEALLLNRSYLVEDNTFTGGGNGAGVAVYARAAELATVTIQENDLTDWETGVYLSATQPLNSDVLANNITLSDIGIQTEGGNDVDINNNIIDNNGTGILVSNGATSPTISENRITNTGLGVSKTAPGIAIVDASANWWGSNVPATVAGEVSAGVDYTPWFSVGTDNAPAAGWQGDFSTLHADDNSPQTGSAGRVQEATTLVSPNGLVYAEAGTYEETVSINGKNLTVDGSGEDLTTILSTSSVPACWASDRHPIICVQNTSNVTFRDLTVDGDGRGNGDAIFYGIAYRNAGGIVEDVTVVDVADTPLSGAQSGVALYACADNGTARTLTVDDVVLTGFQKNGTAFNCANLTVTMSNSTVTGAGPLSFIAQNGIQLAFGASGTFTSNTVSNIGYIPASDVATGHLLYQASGTTVITGSTMSNVEVGVDAFDSQLTFTNNTVNNTTAGMPGMTDWYGVLIDSLVAAPLTGETGELAVQVFGADDTNNSAASSVMMNRAHTIRENALTSQSTFGTGIAIDADATEVTTLTILSNTITTWDVGIEFDGSGVVAADTHYNYIGNNATGVVIRTGALDFEFNHITLNDIGVSYYDSDGVEPRFRSNDIDYNMSFGINHETYTTTLTIVDAVGNYWGDPTGPLDLHLPNDPPCSTLTEYNPDSTGSKVSECVRWYVPLEVTLANFEATPRSSDVLVTWETASETDNLGFNLYRATTPDGTPEKLNGELIPSQVPGGGGALYEWEDADVEVGITYYYWLESVDIQGNGSPYYGPVSATFGAPTAVTLSGMEVQSATLPMLLAAGLVIFGAVGVVIRRRKK